MAYNLNPNQIYGRPAYGVQPRQATFGHQVSGIMPLYPAPYSSGAYPAPEAGAQGVPLRTVYPNQASKPLVYPLPNIPPLAALPKRGQIFTPSTPAGFNAPSGVGNSLNPTGTGIVSPGGKPSAEKPTVQNYYYTLPTGKTPPSRKKDLKKFLFITGAVITGMITTAGVAIGGLFVFAPNHTNFFRKLGSRPFAWANQGLKAFKDTEGSFVRKAIAGGKAVHTAVKTPQEPSESLFTKARLAWWKLFNPEAAKKYEAEKAKAVKTQVKRPIMQQGDIAEFAKGIGQDDVKALKGLAQMFGFNLDSKSLGSILAQAFNEADPKQIANVLKNMQGQAEGGVKLDPAQILADAFGKLKPEQIKAYLPESLTNLSSDDYSKIISKAFNELDSKKLTDTLKGLMGQTGGTKIDTAQLLADIFGKLKPEQVKAYLPKDLTSQSLDYGKIISDAFNDMDSEKITNVLNGIMKKTSTGQDGKSIDPAEIILKVIQGLDESQVQKILSAGLKGQNASSAVEGAAQSKSIFANIIDGLGEKQIKKLLGCVLPKDTMKVLESENTSELADKLWNTLSQEQKDKFDEKAKELGSGAIGRFSKTPEARTFVENIINENKEELLRDAVNQALDSLPLGFGRVFYRAKKADPGNAAGQVVSSEDMKEISDKIPCAFPET